MSTEFKHRRQVAKPGKQRQTAAAQRYASSLASGRGAVKQRQQQQQRMKG